MIQTLQPEGKTTIVFNSWQNNQKQSGGQSSINIYTNAQLSIDLSMCSSSVYLDHGHIIDVSLSLLL
jgi:hypothetical protein